MTPEGTLTLTCWACEREFEAPYGPGRPPQYCGDTCRTISRKVRNRVAYVARAEQRRLHMAEVEYR